MHKYQRILFFSIILCVGFQPVLAQKRTFSPYSRFGVGEFAKPGFARNKAMGGTGIALQSSNYLNDVNPASYASIDTMAFYFEAGVSGFFQGIQSATAQTQQSNANFDYFAIGFPLARNVRASVGVKPYVFTGYHVQNKYADQDQSISMGYGNLSKAYFGMSAKTFHNFSVGAHVSYLFGKQAHLNYYNSAVDAQALSYGIIRDMHISDITFDFGVQYRKQFSEKHVVVAGAVFSPLNSLNGDFKEIKARGLSYDASGNSFDVTGVVDTISFQSREYRKGEFEIPLSYGVGLSYQYDQKLTVSADFTLNQWAKAGLPDYALPQGSHAIRLENSSMFSFGAEYIPNERTANNYLSRVRYRAGLHSGQEYLTFDGAKLNDFGISFGVGLPMRRDKTSLNMTVEWSQRGTTANNLLKENFTRLTLDLTMWEFWFFKRQFD